MIIKSTRPVNDRLPVCSTLRAIATTLNAFWSAFEDDDATLDLVRLRIPESGR